MLQHNIWPLTRFYQLFVCYAYYFFLPTKTLSIICRLCTNHESCFTMKVWPRNIIKFHGNENIPNLYFIEIHYQLSICADECSVCAGTFTTRILRLCLCFIQFVSVFTYIFSRVLIYFSIIIFVIIIFVYLIKWISYQCFSCI